MMTVKVTLLVMVMIIPTLTSMSMMELRFVNTMC